MRTCQPDGSVPVGGGAFDSPIRPIAYPPAEVAINGFPSIGFRCVLSVPGLDMDQHLKHVPEMTFGPKRPVAAAERLTANKGVHYRSLRQGPDAESAEVVGPESHRHRA